MRRLNGRRPTAAQLQGHLLVVADRHHVAQGRPRGIMGVPTELELELIAGDHL